VAVDFDATLVLAFGLKPRTPEPLTPGVNLRAYGTYGPSWPLPEPAVCPAPPPARVDEAAAACARPAAVPDCCWGVAGVTGSAQDGGVANQAHSPDHDTGPRCVTFSLGAATLISSATAMTTASRPAHKDRLVRMTGPPPRRGSRNEM
jgi:hypothetical protein